MHGQRQMDDEEAKKLGLATLISAGIVQKEDKEEIVLAMDSFPEVTSWRTQASYPKSGIVEVKYFDIPDEWIKKAEGKQAS